MDIYNDRIKPLFESSGKTDAEIERDLGLKGRKISQWNMGYTKSYRNYINKIASYFHVSIDYLLGNTDDPTPPGAEKKPASLSEDELSPIKQEAWDLIQEMDNDTLKRLIKIAKAVLEELE